MTHSDHFATGSSRANGASHGAKAARAAVALAIGICVASATGPAHAKGPELSRQTCAAAGGVFETAGGLRTCTTTSTTTETGPVVTSAAAEVRPRCTYHRSCFADLVEHTFTGTSRWSTVVQTVTVRTQRGVRPVRTETTTRILSATVESLSCTVEPALDPSWGPLTVTACADRGLFVA